MNTTSKLSADETALFKEIDFLYPCILNAKSKQSPWQSLWVRVTVKVLAFMTGCLISLAFGLYANPSSAAAKAQAPHLQAAHAFPSQIAEFKAVNR
jgi:hypothetical protein